MRKWKINYRYNNVLYSNEAGVVKALRKYGIDPENECLDTYLFDEAYAQDEIVKVNSFRKKYEMKSRLEIIQQEINQLRDAIRSQDKKIVEQTLNNIEIASDMNDDEPVSENWDNKF